MTDLLLRELTRRARLTADPADATAHLVAAVRAGRLTGKQADLLAWVGHAPAVAARGAPPPTPTTVAWVAGLGAFGKRVCDRAAVACAGLALARLAAAARGGLPGAHPLRELVRALERWVEHPCPACQRAVAERVEAAATAAVPRTTGGEGRGVWLILCAAAPARTLRHRVAMATRVAGLAVATFGDEAVRTAIRDAIVRATWPTGGAPAST